MLDPNPWKIENEMAESNPPVMPEKHAWLEWDGVGAPTAAGRPIPVSRVEPATLGGYVWWRGWEAHIPLETGAICVLWGPYCGWNDMQQCWIWSAPDMDIRLFVPDDRERLCLTLREGLDGTRAFYTHRDCSGLDCVRWRYGYSRCLYADEDLWMYLADWSRYPVVREDVEVKI